MNDDINLIIQKDQHKYKYSTIFLITTAFFGVVFALALSITLYTLFLKTRATDISRDVASAKTRISDYAITKQKILAVSERLNSARNIVAKRNDLSTRTSLVIESIPDAFNIESIKAESNVITVKLGSSSLLLFDDFLENRLPTFVKDANPTIKKIESSTFVRSGGYFLTLAFYF